MSLLCKTQLCNKIASGRPRCSSVSRPQPLHFSRRCPQHIVCSVEKDVEPSLEDMSESDRKKANAEKLRAAEKFMVIGNGTATCSGCGFEYKPEKGDPDFPIARGTLFQDTPSDYVCPTCGAGKDSFETRMKVVAGFAENQRYGLGTNSMTGEQKSLLIYGALALFFVLFIAGYGLE